jgi:hypothetical protein
MKVCNVTGRLLAAGILCAAMIGAAPANAFFLFGDSHTCDTPTQPNCGACSVSCPLTAFPVCRAGISIWRGKAWACLLRPACSCQKSIWSRR